jgi:hypothetical protein
MVIFFFPTILVQVYTCVISILPVTSRAAIASPISQWSKQTPKEAFATAMESWRRRCEKWVRLQGDYVEK